MTLKWKRRNLSCCVCLLRESPWSGLRQLVSICFLQMVHWQSPHMHAYYPALTSWPSLLGDMLADAINCIGFTWVISPLGLLVHMLSIYPMPMQWHKTLSVFFILHHVKMWTVCFFLNYSCSQASSPACTELEMNVLDWLCKALGLPAHFLHHHPDSRGGGILQVQYKYICSHLWRGGTGWQQC